MVLNLFTMRRIMDNPPRVFKSIWKSGVAAIVMGVVAFGVYRLMAMFVGSVAVCCLGAIAAAVVVYVLLVILLKAITYYDCTLLPKGDKIAKILRIH